MFASCSDAKFMSQGPVYLCRLHACVSCLTMRMLDVFAGQVLSLHATDLEPSEPHAPGQQPLIQVNIPTLRLMFDGHINDAEHPFLAFRYLCAQSW